jgi:hypothetical protein
MLNFKELKLKKIYIDKKDLIIVRSKFMVSTNYVCESIKNN